MSDPATAAPEKVPAQPARITPQMAYGSMAGIITSESDKFLQAFLGQAKAISSNNVPDDFLIRFVQIADSFTVACCDRFAAFLREASVHVEVRATSEPVLARLVRNRCFETMDVVLPGYLDLLRRSNIDITQAVKQLASSRVRDAAAQLGPVIAAGGEEERKTLLALQLMRASALIKILDYLGAFHSLAHEFLDYGASKLFGGDMDFALQQQFLQTITDSFHEKLSSAVGLIEGLESVKQRMWDQQRAAESATIKAVALMASQTHVKQKSGVSSLVIAGICAAPIWLLFQLDTINRYVIGLTIAFGLAAIFFLFRGIIHLTKG